ncbi:hypothetical protein [Sandaracinus amylolyticus]|uniref:Uncharacterized protein n=1 Tax=Sandaracinus amylolyticus TaxID=927083 RepID=A0A0F6SGC9_9BACT|nr:hypothetical protein [Sandaracinus amylolyticus]AKF08474.1 hypothetical protein DB32_005623 [Sandaracinus amylolyticus]
MHGTRLRGRAAVIAVATCLAAASSPSRGEAQVERATVLRALGALDAYDLRGVSATFDAIELLTPTNPAVSGIGGEPRLARARAATDIWLVSYLDPSQRRLEQRLARAMGVPSFSIEPTLRDELQQLDRGELRDAARDVRQGLALRDAIEAGEPVSFAGTTGVRRDALLVHVVGTAIQDGDDSELVSWFDDPCGEGAPCDPPYSRWAAPSRVIAAALVEASAAYDRLDQSWQQGDAFARAVWPALQDDARRLSNHVHHPAPILAADAPISHAPYDDGDAARADLVVGVGASGVRLMRVPAVRVREGRLEPMAEETPPIDVDVPSAADAEPAALGTLVERLRRVELAPDAVVAIGAADDVPAERLQRVLASMVAAQRAPTTLVRAASDGSLRAVPTRVIDDYAAGAPGDVLVELRPTGYAVSGRDRDPAEIPRVAAMSLAPLDEDALDALIGSVPGRRVVVRAAGALPARELIDTAFRVAEDGDLVALVGQ